MIEHSLYSPFRQAKDSTEGQSAIWTAAAVSSCEQYIGDWRTYRIEKA